MLDIKVGGVDEHFNLPWHLLLESGELAGLGVDLKWVDCPGGTGQMTKLLRSVELDMAVLLTEGMMLDIFNGNPSRIHKVFVESSLEWGVHVGKESDEVLNGDSITFAISREGSGSHLMALIYANENGIPPESMNFKEVGSLVGALAAFEKGEVDVFLWEKFTTDPYCVSGPLRRIDEIPTPWPCFVIAANPIFYDTNRDTVNELIRKVLKKANDFKQSSDGYLIVAERYGLTLERSKKWFESVRWGNGQSLSSREITRVIAELKLLGKVKSDFDPPISDILLS